MVFKGCQRCGGDMYKEDDLGDTDLVCLQCGCRRGLSTRFSAEMSDDVARRMKALMVSRPAQVAA